MKIIFSSFLIVLIYSNVYSQQISSITISPAQPTEADTIKIYIENTFPSGSCEGFTLFTGMTGSTIEGYGIHCIGMQAVICTDYDTMIFAPGYLSAGTFTFHYQLETGSGSNCFTTFPVIGTTISFDVYPATGIMEMNNSSVNIFPNPSKGKFTLRQTPGDSEIKIYAIDGRLIYRKNIYAEETFLNYEFKKGIFLLSYEKNGVKVYKKIVVE